MPGITLIVGTVQSSQKRSLSLEIPGHPPGVILQESQGQRFQFRLVISVTPQPNFLASILQTSAPWNRAWNHFDCRHGSIDALTFGSEKNDLFS